MSQEDRTILVDSVQLKEGVSQKTGKPFQRTVVAWEDESGTEQYASAFGNSLFTPAFALEKKPAIITVKQNGNFLDLVAIRPAPADAKVDVTPKLGTGDYVTGQKPAIEVRRMCALNASTNATAMTAELLRHQTTQEVTPELYRAAWDAMYAHVFLKNLRSCKAIEDEDIPF